MSSMPETAAMEGASLAFRDTCPAAHLLVGGDGRIRGVNQTLIDILGYAREELIGQHVLGFVEPQDTGRVLEELNRGPAASYDPALEVAVRAKDGTGRTLLLARAQPPRQPGAAGVSVLLTGLDVTDARAAAELARQRELRVLQRRHIESVARLAEQVARHFDGLLATVSACAEKLRAHMPNDADIAGAVQHVLGTTTRAARITARLRDFARPRPLRQAPAEVRELLDSAVEALRPHLGPKVEIAADVPMDMPALLADADALREALVELGLNARDAMPDGGRLRIAAQPAEAGEEMSAIHSHGLGPGPYLRITVDDTGKGMSRETLARAFDPFFTTKDPDRAAGLGLSKVYGCVASHRGAIGIDSRPGCGTRVTILLPLAAGTTHTPDERAV
jgi:PAS domain S-box-containing protein